LKYAAGCGCLCVIPGYYLGFAKDGTRMKIWMTLIVSVGLLAACAGPAPVATGTAAGPTPTEVEGWAGLQMQVPYPFGTPLPPAEASPLDGTYVKFYDDPNTPVPCKRCPDYLLHGGVWLMRFHEGVFRIYHPNTDWKSLSSFTVSGNALALFNDPNCIDITGQYTWTLEEGVLMLSVVDDPCAIRLRAQNITFQPWESCQPPNQEAAISGHWRVPAGCEAADKP
jgi:hypothetical protein